MSNPCPRVRWLTNIILNVRDEEGNIKEEPFQCGRYTEADKIVKHSDGYGDIHLANGKVIEGVLWNEACEFHGEMEFEEGSKATKEAKVVVEEVVEEEEEKPRKWGSKGW